MPLDIIILCAIQKTILPILPILHVVSQNYSAPHNPHHTCPSIQSNGNHYTSRSQDCVVSASVAVLGPNYASNEHGQPPQKYGCVLVDSRGHRPRAENQRWYCFLVVLVAPGPPVTQRFLPDKQYNSIGGRTGAGHSTDSRRERNAGY